MLYIFANVECQARSNKNANIYRVILAQLDITIHFFLNVTIESYKSKSFVHEITNVFYER